MNNTIEKKENINIFCKLTLIGFICGFLNYLLFLAFIIPGIAIPFIVLTCLTDKESEPKVFLLGYSLAIVSTYLFVHKNIFLALC